MARKGRKRRDGKRQPNGRIEPSRTEARDVVRAVAVAQRVKLYGCPPTEAVNFRMGSVIGRLYLRGALSDDQELAAYMWADLDRRYRVTMGLRAPNIGAAAMEIIRGEALDNEPDPNDLARLKARYENARDELLDIPGRLKAVEASALYDEEPDDIDVLVNGLRALSKLWGLTTGR